MFTFNKSAIMKIFTQLFFIGALSVCSFTLGAQTLSNIESVEYDNVYGRFLVGNGTRVIEVDGNGNEVAYFGTEPKADYGMEVMGNVLYTIVGSAVKGYDLTSGVQVTTITITGAQFLNGLASDGDHRVWVTDFNAKKIHEIDFTNLASPSFVEVVSATVDKPNGICYDEVNDRLVFVTWTSPGKIKAVSLTDYTMTTLVANAGVGSIDGIDNDENGNFYICSWTPNQVKKYSNEFALNEVITVAGLSSPADLCYAEEIDTLAIPNSGNNTVKFVGFTPSRVEANAENPFAFNCFPNPVTDKSVLYFTLNQPGVTVVEIMDTQGKLVQTVMEENLPASKHKLVLGELDLAHGNYFWKITSGALSFTAPFIK
jgi:sugar lactone lactonase YvrE